LWNARGLNNKPVVLRALLRCNKFDCLLVCETWLASYNSAILSEFDKEYKVFPGHRQGIRKQGGPRGGVCAFVRKSFEATEADIEAVPDLNKQAPIELICFELTGHEAGSQNTYRVFLVYRSGTNEKKSITRVIQKGCSVSKKKYK
jgi:hypothetical protein